MSLFLKAPALVNQKGGDWGDKVTTVGFSDQQIIWSIMRLYNDGQPFDLDVCYSEGKFWAGLMGPRLKFDIAPKSEDVQKADSRDLPIGKGSVRSIMYDPPFLIRTGTGSKIKDRFSSFPSIPEMFGSYYGSIREFGRVLVPDGFFAFKCQDMVSSGKQVLSHVEIINMARSAGFYCKDIFIRVNENVVWSPNMEYQQHARKTHCYYLIFTKKAPSVYQWNGGQQAP